MQHIALWLVAAILVIAGLAGTIIPGLPGALLILGGMLLAAWIDNFDRVGVPTLVLLGLLTLLTFAIDLLSSMLGASRVGASRQALIGSVLGGLIGILFGIIGLVVGPFIGAFAGEYLAVRRLQQATRVGIGSWVGLAVGTAAKLALAVAMLGVFATGYFF